VSNDCHTSRALSSNQSGTSIVTPVTYTRDLAQQDAAMQSQPKTFAHRYTETGNTESICMTCYVTAARSNDERELLANKAQHVCQPNPLPAAFLFYEA
jgi:hypothetical protein